MFVPGAVTLWVALVALVASTYFYTRALRGEKAALDRARQAYTLSAFAVGLATAALSYLIMTHDFRVHYVYSYSDTSLPPVYLFSTLWAGQEGSFLLWLLSGLLIGLPLIRSSDDDEAHTLIPYNLVQLSLVLILIRQSPFRFLQGLPPGQMPTDGQGLNPLLQNPWMVIHPPIMFVGYAATAVPFALAVAALWRRQYNQWLRRALPWSIVSLVTLGCAIMLGGYWAYVTLGWGGYWGWDPVENASLVPWITSAALVHGLLLQRVGGRFRRLNFSLAILTFVLVVYATFLTRSGVLSDFSVHSFVDLGITGWLVAYLLTFLLIGAAFLAWRWREIPSERGDEPFWTRSVLTVVGIGVLLGAASMVLLGTSAPLLTRMAEKPSQVGPAFYNQVTLPIGIVIALLVAFVPHLGWKQPGEKLLGRLLTAGVAALAGTALAIALGARGALYLSLLTAASFAAGSNLWRLVEALRARSLLRAGGHLAHLGLALMLAGIVISSAFDRAVKLNLPEGQEVRALGRTLVFRGVDTTTVPGKQLMLVEVKDASGAIWTARPRMWTNPKSGQMVANPDLHVLLSHDLYVAPIEWRPGRAAAPANTVELGKSEATRVAGGELRFDQFVREGTHGGEATFSIGVRLTLVRQDGEQTLVPQLTMGPNGMTSSRVELPGLAGGWVEVAGINADQGRVRLVLGGVGEVAADPGVPPVFIAEITIKPAISLVWIGLVVLLVGGTAALLRRARDAGPQTPHPTAT
ncbi:MAG: cytochrome c biogenesis protein CcsA [Thermoanaerobaculaceae bacterium]|nr:cytochrome c biogenesis protein CcsA [Thermoanaerobaculaceae bacterium]MDI9621853.1 cytochrome c biogenesis protein CcsA [Acidobacteriota bacterium]NLH11047.1 cytochrome c biogenesis protein CcsA [Holophagae bacterium]HPW54432.1 cytochrome c biogenesis protein CcsA [Thermoanaerobaculaceae bacterium]